MTIINQKIPEGWSVKRIEELGQVVTGSTPPMSNPENYGGDVCWATAKDFTWKYISDTAVHLSEKGKKISRIVPNGSVLVTCIASIGLNAIAKTQIATNQQINSIIVNDENNNEFIYYQITKNITLLKKYAGDGALPIISKSSFEKIRLLFPPLPEQEKIAEILGTWDLAIEKLTALIEQKKLLKKGLMQRLLTGKQRLPGFSTPWNKVKLKNICDISKGEQLGRLEMTETGVYPVINGGISKSGLTDSYNREKDTITISEGGNSCGFVAFMKERFWCGGHCYALSNLQTNLHFLFQILKSKESDIMKLRVGSGLPNIQKSSLDAFSLHIPTDISEQKAIADILSKADEEIDLLTAKLSALKSQKKGLMQQLLTGKIRVKVA